MLICYFKQKRIFNFAVLDFINIKIRTPGSHWLMCSDKKVNNFNIYVYIHHTHTYLRKSYVDIKRFIKNITATVKTFLFFQPFRKEEKRM